MKRNAKILCFLLTLILMSLHFLLLIPNSSETGEDQKRGIYNLSTAQAYDTIQAAINAANPGDTILIPAGIYSEKVVVNKAVSLVGENKENTILAGDTTGIGFRVTSNNVTIKKFTVKDFEHGIYIDKCQNVSIEDMTITGNVYGVRALYSNQIKVRNCFMINSHCVVLDRSNRSIIENNFFKGYGAATWGGDGVLLDSSFNNTINENVITFLRISLWILDSNWNLVRNNILNYSNYGIQLRNSTNNTFYWNSVFDIRLYTVYFYYNTPNIWDDGNRGNYWGDYEKKYPEAKELDYTWTWDTPYYINEKNQDNHPLMVPTKPTTRVYTLDSPQIKIYSNSSISSISFVLSEKSVYFKTTVPARTMGFCNVSISSSWLWGNFSVYMDGFLLKKDANYTEIHTEQWSIFSITHKEGTHKIIIVGSEAIPELSSLNVFLLLMPLLLLTLILRKKGKLRTRNP